MLDSNGRKRVVITNVSPQVEGGKYVAKAAVQEDVTISADIFGDGHDELDAEILMKREDEAQWQSHPLTFINNDHWEYVFSPREMGIYQFKVQGWIDHYTTWKKGLQKKYDAGQDIKVELEIGAGLLQDMARPAKGKDKKALAGWAEAFKAADADTWADTVAMATGNEVADVVKRNTDKGLATEYPHTLIIDVERKRAAYSTWYELFPRSASEQQGQHGTFKDVKRLLPRIAHMGFDVLYFPPIHPIGEKNRKGKNNSLTAGPDDPGSPWAIGNKSGGHKDIHPELGSMKDFKDLIKETHKYGIEIAMDIAYQCAPDHPWVEQYPQWFKWRPDGTVQYAENPPKKYEDILPINFESTDWKNLWEELKGVIDYWIDKGIHIFRIDNPHTKAFAFWQWMISEVRKEHPQIIFLAEAFTRPRLMEQLGKSGFTQSYSYFTWRNTKKELEQYMTDLVKSDMRYYFRPNFWPNTPDILPPELTAGGDNKHIIRLILAATLSSNYGLYGPVYEFGLNTPMPKKEEYIDNEKYEIKHWNWDAYTKIKELITTINKIRKHNPALQTTWNIELAETDNEQIICYCKQDKHTGNTLIIAVNLDPYNTQSATVKIPVKKLGIAPGETYAVRDLLSGDKYHWQEWNYVQLNPYDMPAHILQVQNTTR